MPNPSTRATFDRRATLGAAAQPLPARPEVPGTEVFEQMFVASRKQFVAMAYSILRNTEDAEDAVQNAFLSGYLHLRNFQGRSALKTWFTRVVLNAALMIRRKRKLVQLVSSREWVAEEN